MQKYVRTKGTERCSCRRNYYVWKKGKKGRKEMQKDGKRQIHVLKAKYLQKDTCTEERKCFAEANT